MSKNGRDPGPAGRARHKEPLNPSVMGTPKQSGRVAKGAYVSSKSEGSGTPPGHGRGGKASRD